MDIERTIEFLVEQAAKHDARFSQIEELLLRGAKMLVSTQEANRDADRRVSALVDAQLRTEQQLSELAAAQKTTELKLQALLDSFGRSGNGH